jgi:hypothetical protein
MEINDLSKSSACFPTLSELTAIEKSVIICLWPETAIENIGFLLNPSSRIYSFFKKTVSLVTRIEKKYIHSAKSLLQNSCINTMGLFFFSFLYFLFEIAFL